MHEGEVQSRNWEWEVVSDPEERLRLIGVTLEERVQQELVLAIGFGELIEKGDSSYAGQIRSLSEKVNEQLEAITRVIRLPLDQKLPVDRKTYATAGKAFIVLEYVPNSVKSSIAPTTTIT